VYLVIRQTQAGSLPHTHTHTHTQKKPAQMHSKCFHWRRQ